MELLKEAELWVAVGLVLFFGLLVLLKVPGAAAKAIDARGLKIQAALDEAVRLREEASSLLEAIKARREETERLAAEMLREATAEAARLEAEAKAGLEEQIKRRTELADRRIALAESQATADVKAAAAELAAQVAEALLAKRLEGATSDPLVDRAVGQLAERLQ
jgi:F-type H+-transporting ATPase subunit b